MNNSKKKSITKRKNKLRYSNRKRTKKNSRRKNSRRKNSRRKNSRRKNSRRKNSRRKNSNRKNSNRKNYTKKRGGGIFDVRNTMAGFMPDVSNFSSSFPETKVMASSNVSGNLPVIEDMSTLNVSGNLPGIKDMSSLNVSGSISSISGLSIGDICNLDLNILGKIDLNLLTNKIAGFESVMGNITSPEKLMGQLDILKQNVDIELNEEQLSQLKELQETCKGYYSEEMSETAAEKLANGIAEASNLQEYIETNYSVLPTPEQSELDKIGEVGLFLGSKGLHFFGKNLAFYLSWRPYEPYSESLVFCSKCKAMSHQYVKRNEWEKRIIYNKMGLSNVGCGISHINKDDGTTCGGTWYKPMYNDKLFKSLTYYTLQRCKYCKYSYPMDFWDGNHPKDGRCCSPYNWFNEEKQSAKKEIIDITVDLDNQIGNLNKLLENIKSVKKSILDKIEGLTKEINELEKKSMDKLTEKNMDELKEKKRVLKNEFANFTGKHTFSNDLEISIYKKRRFKEILEGKSEIEYKYKTNPETELDKRKNDIEEKLKEIFGDKKTYNKYILACIEYENGTWLEKVMVLGKEKTIDWYDKSDLYYRSDKEITGRL